MSRKKQAPVDAVGAMKIARTESLKLSELNLAAYNPRVMPPEKMKSLKASLVKHGLVLGLVVQRRADAGTEHVLIGGHQRVMAMRELCAERGWAEPDEVPCVVLDVRDREAKQLNVTLNNIEGEFDPYKLGQLFADVRPDMTFDDALATGFAFEQIDELVKLVVPLDVAADDLEGQIGDLTGFGKSITLSIEFGTVEARDEAKKIVVERLKQEGRKPGDVLLELMRAHAALPRKDPVPLKGSKKKASAASTQA